MVYEENWASNRKQHLAFLVTYKWTEYTTSVTLNIAGMACHGQTH